jgi:hypothetical protein
VQIHAIHSLESLHPSGPGYLARGWKGERRYAAMERRSVDRYVTVVTAAAITVLGKCPMRSGDSVRGAITKRQK